MLSRITHGFGVLVSKNLRKLRAHDEGETPPVTPIATNATDEERHHVHVVGRVQREGRHDSSLAADHVRLHGVPDIVRPAHKRFEIGQLLLAIHQSIRGELTEHLDVVIDDVACLRGPRGTIEQLLNPGLGLIYLSKNRGQRLLLGETVSNALARHLENPVEGPPGRLIRQFATSFRSTQFEEHRAERRPVIARGESVLLREPVDERRDMGRRRMPIGLGDIPTLPGQSSGHVGGDLLGGDRSLPSAPEETPEVLEQSGALADQTGSRSLPGGDEKQPRDRHADIDERVGILGLHKRSSGCGA